MAVFLLMTIAVLLALYYNSKLSQALNNFIKSLLNKVNNYKRSHTNESTTITASDGENVESSELYFTKTEVRSTPGIWDIPGPKRFPLIGTKWIFLAYFWKYKLSGLPKVYAGNFYIYHLIPYSIFNICRSSPNLPTQPTYQDLNEKPIILSCKQTLIKNIN